MRKSIVCFGEVLWDVLPTGQQPSDAPFNVAVHPHQLGVPTQLISHVGGDEPGAALRFAGAPGTGGYRAWGSGSFFGGRCRGAARWPAAPGLN